MVKGNPRDPVITAPETLIFSPKDAVVIVAKKNNVLAAFSLSF